MNSNATGPSEQGSIQWQKRSLQRAFCRARLQQAGRLRRTLRLRLRQQAKRCLLLVGQTP